MQYVSALRKRSVAVVVAGGAILFLAGFAHGYRAPDPDAGWHTEPAER
jgi:hypothetical protein